MKTIISSLVPSLILWLLLGTVVPSLLACIVLLGGNLWFRSRSKGFEVAIKLIAKGKLAQARKELDRLDTQWPTRSTWLVDSMLGNVLWFQGEQEEALERLQSGFDKNDEGASGRTSTAFMIALVSSVSGKEVKETVRHAMSSAPSSSKLFAIMRGQLALSETFHGCKNSSLPSSSELKELGLQVMETNRFAEVLVLLAWECSMRGEKTTALAWLREANSREMYNLSLYMPKLHAWQQSFSQTLGSYS